MAKNLFNCDGFGRRNTGRKAWVAPSRQEGIAAQLYSYPISKADSEASEGGVGGNCSPVRGGGGG